MSRPKVAIRLQRRPPNLRLQELRINAGMSTTDLAYRAGTSAKTIRMAESGFTPGPRLQFQIAAVFALRPLDLWSIDRQRVAA